MTFTSCARLSWIYITLLEISSLGTCESILEILVLSEYKFSKTCFGKYKNFLDVFVDFLDFCFEGILNVVDFFIQ